MKNNIKELVLSRESALTAALTAAVLIAPLLHSQLVTGTVVNAALFSAVMLVGFRAAAVVAVVPSLIALSVGTLPLAFAAMVPFIMAGNLALAGVFSMLKKANYWVAAVAASAAKFIFLALSANIILSVLTQGKMSLALASMMGWPQLVTALLGSVAAYAVFERKWSKKA